MEIWDTVISIIAQVLTLITIVLVYQTLKEMRNQRIASQKPDLIILKSGIHGFGQGHKDYIALLIPRFWSKSDSVKPEVSNFISGVPVNLYNVGLAVAKNIELIWEVSYSDTLQQIKDYCYTNSIPIVLQLEGKSSNDDRYGFRVLQEGRDIDIYFNMLSERHKHDFLMPVSVTEEGLNLYSPNAVRELISIIMYLKSYHKREFPDKPELEIDFPRMVLTVNYEDLGNNQYWSSYVLTFSVVDFAKLPNENLIKTLLWLWRGEFEFKKIDYKKLLEITPATLRG